jgi:hypothetical protein
MRGCADCIGSSIVSLCFAPSYTGVTVIAGVIAVFSRCLISFKRAVSEVREPLEYHTMLLLNQ